MTGVTTPGEPRGEVRQGGDGGDASDRRRAAFLLLISSSLFSLMAAGTKLATHRFPGPQIALVRFLTGVLVTGLAIGTGRVATRPRRWGWLFTRGFFGGSAVVAYFTSIQAVPVGVATLLNQTQPVFTMLFSWALLAERPRRGALAALAMTLTGVAIIVGFRHLKFHGSRGELLGVFSAIASGIAVTAIRAARRGHSDGHPPETAWTVFFSFTLLGALVTLPFVFPPLGHWVPPTASQWALLFAVGLVGVAAQLIMTEALGHLTGVQSGIIAQLTVPLTILLGLVLFDEHLTASFALGAVLTLSGVMMTIGATAAGMPRRRPRI
jgi:drug/metabolite transporter (DMT)-like permease